MLRPALIVLLIFLGARIAGAQGRQYQFSQLNISQGLSHNQVNSILKDRKGFMWFGTMSGLNRYDGYTFRVFRHVQSDSSSINEDNVLTIKQGPFNKLWIQTRAGFNIYDPVTEKFDRKPERFLRKFHVSGTVTDLTNDQRGNFWVITSKGVYRLNETKEKARLVLPQREGYTISSSVINSAGNLCLIYSDAQIAEISAANNKIIYSARVTASADTGAYKIFADKENALWVYTTDAPKGIYYISANRKTTEHYTKEQGRFRLNTNNIYSINEDNKGIIWVATDHGGINLLNKKEGTVAYVMNREADEKSIAQNSTTTIYRDSQGIMWVGTFKRGISYYHESIIKFPVYRHLPSEPLSLSNEDVNRFVEDAKGNIWIGTNGGGLVYFDRRNNTFRSYKHDPRNSNSLSNDVVVSLCIDHEQRLWIGTYFGGLSSFDGKNFTHYRHSNTDPNSLSDDRVWEILEDSEHNLWIGTLAGGLSRFNPRTGAFKHYKAGGGGSVASNYIAALLEDRHGNIWIGTNQGLDVLNKKTGRLKHYALAKGNTDGLSNNNVMALLQDRRGLIWIGTQDGLTIYDPGKDHFRTLRIAQGLADNTILTLLEDDNGNIWLSSANGISCIRLSGSAEHYAFDIKSYDELDGLQGREFNENAALKTGKGELVFGGAKGFNIFCPSDIKVNKQVPVVVLTAFQLFNKSVAPGEAVEGDIILQQAISETQEIELEHNQNVFSIEFAALTYSNAAKNRYAYKLDGFNDKWLTTDGITRRATFTNLDPGEYVFRVKASNDAGIWNNHGVSLRIIIRPPFWETPLAYGLYGLSAVLILLYIRRRGIRKLKAQFAIQQEREASKRMHELDVMKIKFFTNVSHEFRTPLSLILTPLDKLLKEEKDADVKSHLQLIQRNARRLLNLVNQLMDFRKMEVQELKLQAEEGDIVGFIKESFQSFTDLAEKKNIRFTLQSELSSLQVSFDHDKIERILFNLLANAFKFTSEGGCISLNLNLASNGECRHILQILVKDTGIGIPKDKQEKIFERFFQNETPGSIVNQGSGIGLAITREFVNLHNGSIQVESEPGKGTCFIVGIPVQSAAHTAGGTYLEEEQAMPLAPLQGPAIGPPRDKSFKKHSILLIEDSEDFRFYLKDNLRQYYNIIESPDGKAGWAKALSEHPDLIVSDVSMPQMNGIDLCRKIKQDKRTTHIPVILLTALTGEEQLLRGLETGASDYMTKPFNFEVLLSKIKNLLEQHECLRKTYQKQIGVKPSEVDVLSVDEKFMQHALSVIEMNISNPEFSVEEFSREMAMSRVALYKKLLLLTRQTPIEFIRSIRLKRAAQLLEKSQFTVAEVAYEVGFNNPKYFARYFKAEFGVLPSSWNKTLRAADEKPTA